MQKYFFVRTNGRYVRVDHAEILYVESCGNYLKIAGERRTVLVLMSMKQIEQLLPAGIFIRVHRSFIVSLDHITEFTRDLVFLKDRQLPIGVSYKGQLEKAVNTCPGSDFPRSITVPFTYLGKKAVAN